MNAKLLVPALLAACLIPVALPGKRLGIFPNTVVDMVQVGSLTRVSTASCGQCHAPTPSATVVQVVPGARSNDAGTTTSIQVVATSTSSGNDGGFTADVTAGSFVAGSTTQVNATGDAVTHTASTNGRSWQFTWKAPTTPGLAEMYVVANAVNGNLRADAGDLWAFHGSSPTNTVSTPVRLYANAPGCVAVGGSCADGYGNYSVLGAPLPPTVGNSAFKLESHGLPPGQPLLLMMTIGGNLPAFDMSQLGAPGCFLRTTLQLQFIASTTTGDASRAEGTFTVPVPIPNQPILKGLKFTVQNGVIDGNSQRLFPMVVTNALEVTIL